MNSDFKIELKTWGVFLLLNSLYFIPGYYLDRHESSFFPLSPETSFYLFFKEFFIRENHDIFRIGLDFFFLSLGYFFIRKKISIGIMLPLFSIVYLVTFIYQVYHSFFFQVYSSEPLFLNDFEAIKIGFMIVYQGINLKFILAILLILSVLTGVIYSIKYYLNNIKNLKVSLLSKIIASFIGVLFLFNLKYRFQQTPYHTFQLHAQYILNNIQGSISAHKKIELINIESLVASNDYSGIKYSTKPNIIFIAIESYGRALLDNTDFRDPYLATIKSSEKQLIESNWNCTSGLSIAPVHGGLSWVSYGSLGYGFNIENNATYSALLKNTTLPKYDHLFNVLRASGYKNYRLAPIPKVGRIKIPWDKYNRFYCADEWILHDDLNYTGKLYGFGPSPSDQYSLNFALEKIKEDRSPLPYSLFFITQNSHNPFISPDSIVADWKDINDNSRQKITSTNFLGQPNPANYLSSIQYEIEMLTKTIIDNGSENDIYILIGDHQPPFITEKTSSKEVPLHIISKNKDFINGFEKYGLQNGLTPKIVDFPIKHEGFYSMFMTELITSYSDSNVTVPKYLPNGVEFGK